MTEQELNLQNGEPQETPSIGLEDSHVAREGAEEPRTEKPVDHEPPPEHPRFKEIYGRMKHYERQFAESDERHKALLEHNKKLNEAIGVLVDKMDVQTRPDPVAEPEKYEEWLIQRAKRELEKDMKPEPKMPELPQYQSPPNIDEEKTNKTRYQIAAMEAAYDDYNPMIYLAEKDMEQDPVLRNEIWSSDNPPKKAYLYAKEKMERAQKDRATMNSQTFAEAPSSGQPPPSSGLNDVQRQVAIRLGIGEEAYAKQLDAMRKAGIYRGDV